MKDKVLEVNDKKYYVIDELISDKHYVMCLDVTNPATEEETIAIAEIEKTDMGVNLKDVTDPNMLKTLMETFVKNAQ